MNDGHLKVEETSNNFVPHFPRLILPKVPKSKETLFFVYV